MALQLINIRKVMFARVWKKNVSIGQKSIIKLYLPVYLTFYIKWSD